MIRREILLKNAENGSDKLGEGKWQIGPREMANQHMQLDRGNKYEI